ncbi:hypothetical protein ACP3WA_25765, partial [Salmonella enterica]|uniref:hypothetical protein n=1 Tax=Salmonella enterica TaxID=28901 RepID=UPI003CE8B920
DTGMSWYSPDGGQAGCPARATARGCLLLSCCLPGACINLAGSVNARAARAGMMVAAGVSSG